MKMTPADWTKVRHFEPTEFVEPAMMEQEVVFLLDAIRHAAGDRHPCFIHASFATAGHDAPNTRHVTGEAIDCHFRGMGVIEQFLLASQFNPGGLGFYPLGVWANPGIHIDCRPLEPYQKAARWWKDERGQYQPITVGTVKKFIWREGE